MGIHGMTMMKSKNLLNLTVGAQFGPQILLLLLILGARWGFADVPDGPPDPDPKHLVEVSDDGTGNGDEGRSIYLQENREHQSPDECLRVSTKEDAVKWALNNHPELRRAGAEVRIREGGRVAAAVFPNPQLGLETEKLGLRPGQMAEGTGLWVTLKQTVPVPSVRKAALDVADSSVRAGERAAEAKRNRIARDVRFALAMMEAAQRELALAQELERIVAEQLRVAQERAASGHGLSFEITRAKTDLNLAGLETDGTRRGLDDTVLLVNRAMGATHLSQHHSEAATAAKTALAGLFAKVNCNDAAKMLSAQSSGQLDAELSSLEELESKMLAQNPYLEELEMELDAAQALVQLERRKTIPSPEILVGYSEPLGTLEGHQRAWKIGLGLPIPLFDRRRGELAVAAALVERTEAEISNTKGELLHQLRSAHRDYREALHRWRVFRRSVVPGALAGLDAAREAFRLGKADYQHVLETRRSFADAQKSQLQSELGATLHRLQMDYLLGQAGYYPADQKIVKED